MYIYTSKNGTRLAGFMRHFVSTLSALFFQFDSPEDPDHNNMHVYGARATYVCVCVLCMCARGVYKIQ